MLFRSEPSVTGGNPVIADNKVFFNDMLGNSIGTKDGETLNLISRDSFGGGNEEGFFTGKPYVEGLGYAFLFRNYRPELGKWQTSDPLGYPDGWNNFAYCNNWVTDCFDWLGAKIVKTGNVAKIEQALAYLSKTDAGKKLISYLDNSPTEINIKADFDGPHNNYDFEDSYTSESKTGDWNITEAYSFEDGSTLSPSLLLAHELGHAFWDIADVPFLGDEEEQFNIELIEDNIAKQLNELGYKEKVRTYDDYCHNGTYMKWTKALPE